MIKRSFSASVLFTGIVLSGVFAAPAFGQSYGVMPRGACAKSTARSSMAQPQVAYQHVAHDAAYSAPAAAPVRETQRPRRRGFGSPF
ncbi:MAG: hypothetical protein FJX20_10345 [Alphaproteobacteria bacterium]|nr:hypothetical protein [Alphaproteobacteria bacterium]